MTPERKREIEGILDEYLDGSLKAKPKLVCVEGRVVADAEVIVSSEDPNWYKGPKAVHTNGEVRLM